MYFGISKVTKPTVRTIPPGGAFLAKRNGRLIKVPETHLGLRCEIGQCEYDLVYPKREADRVEKVRKQHIEVIHWRELVEGRCQISEESLKLCETEPSSSSS